jgi:negative regulator of flagellin synthesis FlgM
MNPIDTMNGIKPTARVDTDRPSGGVKSNAGGTQTSAARSNTLADDTVELTDTASRLNQLTQDVAKVDGVDVERVEAIRQQISEGSYQVDADRIAEALVRLEKDLI